MTEQARNIFAVFAALSACSGVAGGCNSPDRPSGAQPTEVTIRQQSIEVEVVRTREEQTRGLSERDSLAWGSGMLFPYERPAFVSFWMKGMRFDIDIVWIRDGRIIGIAERVPYPSDPEAALATVRSPELIDRVLEVPAGYASAHGWRRGDRVRVSPSDVL
jgi:uncharacterized membrane protein (UPF0127 family)